ncbi:MAG: aminopeptidase [Deltaproteobacteria bacterium HGW-Deltaproteobacteria-15]|jgi:aminopeptidase|nr:MAG: aminopeptidase [Deltaproteobacteria bacterium HGW-Deltaproteobacteria-15]
MKFTQDILDKYGDVLLWALRKARKGPFGKRDVVLVNYHLDALPLAETLQYKLLHRGFHPVLRLRSTSRMERTFFDVANPRQLEFRTPGDAELNQALNGAIYLFAPDSLTHLSAVDPTKVGKAAVAAKPFRDILDRRDEKGLFGWTLCMVPTPALAEHASISMGRYSQEVIRACFLDDDDPVNRWEQTYKDIGEIKKWLNSLQIKLLHLESETIDLRIRPGIKRKWVGLSGHNIPSFEIFVSPDWRGTEGVYFSNQPSFRSGNRVENIKLVFQKGRAIRIEAEKGEEFAVKQASMDKGAARVGEFSLTDKRFSRINRFMANTLYDENYGGRYGNSHVALGSSYSDTFDGDRSKLTGQMKKELGFNESALHWDMVNTGKKTVTAHLVSGKKKIIYENGMFTI